MRKKWIAAAAPIAMLVAVSVGHLVGESQDAPRLVPKPAPVTDPVVAIAHGADYTKTTLEAIHEAGGLESLVPGKTVFIKPNIVAPSPPGAGRVTDPRVVQAIVDECNRLGAKSVVVGESPVEGDNWTASMAAAGYDTIKGATLFNTNVPQTECYSLIPERSLVGQPFWIPKTYMDADVLIDVPILKTHYTAGVTLGLKNLGIGVPPLQLYESGGNKGKLHDFGISKTIPDINSIRKPDFVIIDGMVGGEGNGPVDPDPVNTQLVIAGRDVVSVDTVGALVMGFDPHKITHLVYAAAEGLGESNIAKIKVVGKSIADVQQSFVPPDPQGYPYIETTVVREATTAPVIDGKLDDWAGAWPNTIADRTQMSGDAWKGPSDLSAKSMLMHDKKNLYFAFDVADNVAVPETAYSDHEKPTGDGVELFLSFAMPFEQSMDAARVMRDEKRDFGLQVAFNPKMVGVYSDGGKKPLPGTKAVAVKTSTGYVIEGCVPMSALGRPDLAPRQEIWADFGVVDVDQAPKYGHVADVKTRAVWNNSIAGSPYDTPNALGRALIDAPKSEW